MMERPKLFFFNSHITRSDVRGHMASSIQVKMVRNVFRHIYIILSHGM